MQTQAGASAASPASGSQDSEREIACSMSAVLLRLVRKGGGEPAVAALLKRADSKREPAYLETADNWISLAELTALLHAGIAETGDRRLPRRVGEHILRQHAGTQVATLLRSLGSTEAVLNTVTETSSRLSAVTQMESLETRPGHAVVRALAREGFTRLPVHCELMAGLLSATPMLFGLPLASVDESECQTRGDRHCMYTVSWDAELAAAAADPQQRVTALEAQLLATTERLQSAYATAGDLISSADLETLLRRIVERAANTVRAPSHVLAVRTPPHEELHVYGEGIDDQRAKALALAALEAREGDTISEDSLLVVEVSSARRRYGKLIARYPGSAHFFPQEEELLTLYAKHAAAVLDIASALEESARRHEQVSSLLALAHAVSHAGTSEEVGQRLAQAVPEVVDCDRMGVWLWDPDAGALTSTASWGRTVEQDARMTSVKITLESTPALSRMMTDRQPQFYELGTADPIASQLMAAMEVVAVAVVPIVARDAFLGALMVSVTHSPQRLRSDGELLERLMGVAAIAATSIQNGQLVDTLRYRASHDTLTGHLNRLGFRQHTEGLLAHAAAGSGPVGLLFVDLDDFKQINDTHGHEVGDEVLRAAAKRLDSITRGGDLVARLGGDEFAVVLANVAEQSHVHAAEARVRVAFIEPLVVEGLRISVNASVGGGLWPEHGNTASELLRHADAAMYLDKAKNRRQCGAEAAAVTSSGPTPSD
jgi:diguanylate cyclase (GGDEF)-like protein